jgi:uncharacterized repeat protein (TIGR01451 family)
MYFSKFYQKPLHILNILVATVFVLQTLLFPFMLIEASAEGGSNLQNDSSQVQVDKDDTPSATPDPADDNNSDSNTSDKSIEDQNQESSETDDQTSSENKTSSDNSEETENIDQTIQEDNSDDSNEQTDETESSKATSEQTEPCTEFTLEVFRDKWDGNKFQQVETKCVSYEELTNGFDVYQLIKVDLKEQMKHAGERFSFRLTSNSQTLDNNLYYLNTQGLKGGKYKIFIDNQDTAERKTIFDGDVWKYDNQVVSRGYDSYGNENVKFVLEYTDQHVNQESKDFKFFIEKKDQETYGYALNDGQTCNQDAFTATYFKDIQKLNPGNQNRDNLSHDNLLNKPFDQITDYTQEEGYVSTRCETNIDYNWGESSPHKLYNIGSKKYGVRYSKDIPQDKLQDKYTFNLTAKDYHRLVFNNQVVSAKFDKKVHEENKTVELTEEDKQQDSINLTFEHIFRQVWNGHEGTLKLNVEGESTSESITIKGYVTEAGPIYQDGVTPPEHDHHEYVFQPTEQVISNQKDYYIIDLDESQLQALGGVNVLTNEVQLNTVLSDLEAVGEDHELPYTDIAVLSLPPNDPFFGLNNTAYPYFGQYEDFVGTLNYAAVFCHYSDLTVVPATPNYNAWMDELEDYFNVSSYGKLNVNIDRYYGPGGNWYDMGLPRSYFTSAASTTTEIEDICTDVADGDINFDNYEGVILIVNDSATLGSAFGGFRIIDNDSGGLKRTMWLPEWSYNGAWYDRDDSATAHELGHSLRIPHSGRLTTGAEYDNEWDIMSDSRFFSAVTGSLEGGDFIAYYKDRLGWIDNSERFTFPTGSAANTINLQAISEPNVSAGDYRVAYIQLSNGILYSIEARAHTNIDSNLALGGLNEGILVHRIDPLTADRRARLADDIHTAPNVAFVPGDSFTLPVDNIVINVCNRNGTVFEVSIGTICGTSTISGTVWNDNSPIDSQFNLFTEGRRNGITIDLIDAATGVTVDTTISAGGVIDNYQFNNVASGDYQLRFSTNAGNNEFLVPQSTTTFANNFSSPDPVTGLTPVFTVTAGSNVNADAGYVALSEIRGWLWHDVDNNGLFNLITNSEPILDGWEIRLYEVDALGSRTYLRNMLTDNTLGGTINYQFLGLRVDRQYQIEVVMQNGWVLTQKNVGGFNGTWDSDVDTFTAFSDVLTLPTNYIDIGVYPSTTIGDQVFSDYNGNGLQDAGEPGLDGVTVELLDLAGNPVNDAGGNPIPAQTTTTVGGTAGFYRFENLVAGTYLVRYTLPNGSYIFSPANQGVDDNIDSDATPINATQAEVQVTVNPNDNFTNVDAGLVPQIDILVTKNVSDPTPNEGDTISYSITVQNNSLVPATNVELTDVLPAGVTYNSIVNPPQTYDPVTGIWNIGTMAPGANETLILAVTVDTGTGGQTITNTASITNLDQTDIDTTNDTDDAVINVVNTTPQANLSLTGTSTNPTPAAGDTFDYQITLTNNGPDTIAGIDLENILSAGQTFVGSSDPSYNPVTGIWNIPSIPAGTSITLTITVSVDGTVTYGTPLSLGSTVVVTTPAQYTETNPGDESVVIMNNIACPNGTTWDNAGSCIALKVCPTGSILQANGDCAVASCILPGSYPVYGTDGSLQHCRKDYPTGYIKDRFPDRCITWQSFLAIWTFQNVNFEGYLVSGRATCGFITYLPQTPSSSSPSGITLPPAICDPATPAQDPNYADARYCKI